MLLKRDKTTKNTQTKNLFLLLRRVGGSPKQKKALINFSSHHQLNFLHNNILNTSSRTIRTPGRYGVERRRKEREESEERKAWGQTTGGEWRRRGSSKKRGRDGLPVPSTPGDEEEDTKLNPVCAIASPLADGKLTKKALKVVKKGTRVLFFFVQQRGERRRRFFF